MKRQFFDFRLNLGDLLFQVIVLNFLGDRFLPLRQSCTLILELFDLEIQLNFLFTCDTKVASFGVDLRVFAIVGNSVNVDGIRSEAVVDVDLLFLHS